jgi:hypothetical protein
MGASPLDWTDRPEPNQPVLGDNRRVVLDWERMVLTVATVGVLVLLLRWAYGGRRGTSLVERRPTVGRSDEYGLLVPITSPASYIEGELTCRRLEQAGIRTTLVGTADGPRVMVFPEDAARARQLLASG